ncbi:GUN4 domain-containing protein [Nodosilinea nodulosa]|uniref:GUN4 domain-containing protein n=1 Tax=Nodosilinea nodulosa TaxID=416001 RepID=UPI0002DCA71A|nr:GUN4 domain-containing protein [Nodosilinea nodulosa]
MSHIFISYSRQDQDYVALLAQALKSHHLPVWLDDHIDYGTTWPRVIREQLERCQLVLVVMSPRSEESHWVQCELTHALEIRKPIFPLLLEGPRWFSVAALQTVDVIGGKLPPARFFDTLRPYFPAPTPTAESTLIQDVATDAIPPAPVGWAPPTTTLVQKPTPAQPAEDDDLSSEKGVDYRKLRDLLKAGQWRESDRETARRMLEAVERKENDWIREKELLNFPCTDLKMIDALWVKYSYGKWGFSVQKRIYVECGAKLDSNYPGDKIWHEFCHRVGWRKGNAYVNYSSLTFDLKNSPVGEFPVWVGWGGGVGWRRIFSRIENCKL